MSKGMITVLGVESMYSLLGVKRTQNILHAMRCTKRQIDKLISMHDEYPMLPPSSHPDQPQRALNSKVFALCLQKAIVEELMPEGFSAVQFFRNYVASRPKRRHSGEKTKTITNPTPSAIPVPAPKSAPLTSTGKLQTVRLVRALIEEGLDDDTITRVLRVTTKK